MRWAYTAALTGLHESDSIFSCLLRLLVMGGTFLGVNATSLTIGQSDDLDWKVRNMLIRDLCIPAVNLSKPSLAITLR